MDSGNGESCLADPASPSDDSADALPRAGVDLECTGPGVTDEYA